MKSFFIKTLNIFHGKVMHLLHFGCCQILRSYENLAMKIQLYLSNKYAENYIQSCIYRKVVFKMLLNDLSKYIKASEQELLSTPFTATQ